MTKAVTETVRIGPSTFLESRNAVRSELVATSTQSPPLEPLKLLLRHITSTHSPPLDPL